MEIIMKYFMLKKELYGNLLQFINEENDTYDDYFDILVEQIKNQKITKSKEELKHFLRLIESISSNYHRYIGFFNKIERIVEYIKDDIRNILPNNDIFSIFENNKRILLFLFNNKILEFDDNIYQIIKNKQEVNGIRYYDYFLSEIKIMAQINNSLNDEDIDDQINKHINYEEKRKLGENDSYICSLIRDDLIEEFVSYVNRTNIDLSSKISKSIFETNYFLNCKEPTLIEYAAFFGSIQIFQYLKSNGIKLNSSLWIYAIHSNNPEFINLLEEYHIEPPNNSYETCFLEAIKCHFNDLAQYFEDNSLVIINHQSLFNEIVIENSFRYYNFTYFHENINESYLFFCCCQYDYDKIVKFILKSKKNEIQSSKI